MSKWITHRRPTKQDAQDSFVLLWCPITKKAHLTYYRNIEDGDPWMAIAECPPYVMKPKRFRVEQTALDGRECFAIYDDGNDLRCSFYVPTREAAERIAAIYEEVMP